MTSYSINLLFINEPQCLESSLHTLLVATCMSASFQVVKNTFVWKVCIKWNALPKGSILLFNVFSDVNYSTYIYLPGVKKKKKKKKKNYSNSKRFQ